MVNSDWPVSWQRRNRHRSSPIYGGGGPSEAQRAKEGRRGAVSRRVSGVAMKTFVLCFAVLGFFTAPAHAQTPAKLPYPEKLVTLVTHSSPGAGSDVVLREM